MSSDEGDNKTPDESKACPVNEWVRHLLYVGGMVALHTGLGASAAVASKPTKCPISEWARHAVYVGGFVALAVKAGMATKKLKEEPETKTETSSACPVNELYRHALYVAGMVGVVALINARKK